MNSLDGAISLSDVIVTKLSAAIRSEDEDVDEGISVNTPQEGRGVEMRARVSSRGGGAGRGNAREGGFQGWRDGAWK